MLMVLLGMPGRSFGHFIGTCAARKSHFVSNKHPGLYTLFIPRRKSYRCIPLQESSWRAVGLGSNCYCHVYSADRLNPVNGEYISAGNEAAVEGLREVRLQHAKRV